MGNVPPTHTARDTVLACEDDDGDTPIVSYLFQHALDEDKMQRLCSESQWHPGLDPAPETLGIAALVKAFQQNTTAGRLEDTVSKPVTLARMVDGMFSAVTKTRCLHNCSLETRVKALKTVASHILGMRWNSPGSTLTTTSFAGSRSFPPRLGFRQAGSGPKGSVAALTTNDAGCATKDSASSSINNSSNSTADRSSTRQDPVSSASNSIFLDQNAQSVLTVWSDTMAAKCSAGHWDEALAMALDSASFPLLLAFVSNLLGTLRPSSSKNKSSAFTLSMRSFNSIARLPQGNFAAPPGDCVVAAGPFFGDILLNSKQSSSPLLHTRSIVMWFRPNIQENVALTFSLLDSKKVAQLDCTLSWACDECESKSASAPMLSASAKWASTFRR